MALETEIESRTINFDNTMTRDEIQAVISGIGKHIPGGVVITIQFADGTYTLDDWLVFAGFIGNGQIKVQGNRNEDNANDKHTTQQVFLDFSGQVCDGLVAGGSLTSIEFYNLKVKILDSAAEHFCFHSFEPSSIRIWYNYAFSTGNSRSIGFHSHYGSVQRVQKCVAGKLKYGIEADVCGQTYSCDNIDNGVNDRPVIGLHALANGVIGKAFGQPVGNTQNELAHYGGAIR